MTYDFLHIFCIQNKMVPEILDSFPSPLSWRHLRSSFKAFKISKNFLVKKSLNVWKIIFQLKKWFTHFLQYHWTIHHIHQLKMLVNVNNDRSALFEFVTIIMTLIILLTYFINFLIFFVRFTSIKNCEYGGRSKMTTRTRGRRICEPDTLWQRGRGGQKGSFLAWRHFWTTYLLNVTRSFCDIFVSVSPNFLLKFKCKLFI